MAKSKKKQKAEAALKASQTQTAEARQLQEALAAKEAAAAAAAEAVARQRKALAALPKAVKVKRPRYQRPAKRTPPESTARQPRLRRAVQLSPERYWPNRSVSRFPSPTPKRQPSRASGRMACRAGRFAEPAGYWRRQRDYQN